MSGVHIWLNLMLLAGIQRLATIIFMYTPTSLPRDCSLRRPTDLGIDDV